MTLRVDVDITEDEIGDAIRDGRLQLAEIIQWALTSSETTDRLIREIQHLGGTAAAGRHAARFAAAMMGAAE